MDPLLQLQQLWTASAGAEHPRPILGPQAIVEAWYLFLIPLFPLLGAVVNATLGKRLQARYGKRVTSHVAIGAMGLSFLVALVALVQMVALPADQRHLQNHLWNMFTAGELQADLAFALDPLSMTMTLVITFIGTLIHVYSTGYMADEPAYWRFFCYLNLFVFSMLLLVMGDNFAVMFFGWEGVGLCSYLLIGFWYEDPEKARAALKAFVTNRFGDFGFVLGLFLLFWVLGGSWVERLSPGHTYQTRWQQADASYRVPSERTLRYEQDPSLAARQPPALYAEVVRQQIRGGYTDGPVVTVKGGVRVGPTLNFRELRDQLVVEATGVKKRLEPVGGVKFLGAPVIVLIGILLFIGATAKSAQIPLYVWLPDAMAGPTPVSALIHAATMVTAGVYMVARLNFVFALSPEVMTVIAVTGAATAAFAATIGFAQNDIKKVLAYSTVSQLGFMFIGVGVGAYWAGVFHLLTHAFFKACLFLGSGSVIMGCHHEQDMRKMGGLAKLMPTTARTYFYACVAIAGFPIANGFFSKDEILWKAFTAGHNLVHPDIGRWVWFIGWLSALGTSFYMWRSYYLTFSGEYRGGAGHGHGSHAAHDAGTAPAHAPRPAGVHRIIAWLRPSPAARPVHSLGAASAAELGAGHAHGPHESPAAMTWVLRILALGCALTVVLGFWPPLGHYVPALAQPLFERWLEPVLAPTHDLVAGRVRQEPFGLEVLLVLASVAVATVGLLLARWMYKDARSQVPARFVAAFPRLHRWVYAKYYVDELYQKTVIAGSLLAARAAAVFDRVVVDGAVNGVATVGRFLGDIDGAIDRHLVDGAVNGVANAVLGLGRRMRALQSGRLQHYVFVAVAGALAVVGITYLIR